MIISANWLLKPKIIGIISHLFRGSILVFSGDDRFRLNLNSLLYRVEKQLSKTSVDFLFNSGAAHYICSKPKYMLRPILPLALVSLFLFSCGGSETSKEVDADDAVVDDSNQESMDDSEEISDMADFQFHTMIANLPSPLETFHLISEFKVGMDGVELTDTERSKELSTMSAKAYGYGMYMTDMGFMAYEKQNQRTLQYYQTCRDLAMALGAGEVFDQTISANFEENTSSEEKFIRMMDEAFNSMDQYMVDNERFVNATEIFVGSWVETQLIATEIIKDEPMNEQNAPIYAGVYEQKMHASNLMNVLSEIETELEEDVVNNVEDLMLFYAGFSSAESITQEDLVELEKNLKALKESLLS